MMVKKTFILFSVCQLFNSCLLYKEADKKNTDELKKESQIIQRIEIPEQWILDQQADAATFQSDWIQELYDPELKLLISEGLQYNADIIIAEEKLNQIELAMDIAGSNLYPSVNAVAGSSSNLTGGSQVQKLGVQANWELDLWGKNKSNKMASVSDYFSSQYKNEKLKQTIASLIAKSYFLNIAGNIQEDKVNKYLKLTQDLEKLYLVQNKVGNADAIALSNIKAEIVTLNGYLEKIRNGNAQSRRALELLIGKYPEGKIKTKSSFNDLNKDLPSTFPLPLIENRPDILAQHYLIEKEFYEVQVAKAARLPSLSISSTIGGASTNVGAINSIFSNPLINVGGSLATPIFNGGKLKKNVAIENSQQKQVVEEYAKSVLNAMNELESSWGSALSIEKQINYNEEAIKELNKNIDLTKKKIKIGTSNNFELIQKQRNLLKTEVNVIDLQLQERIERINLYLALGAPNFNP